MSDSLMKRLTATPEGMRLYQQERAIQEVTDLICLLMAEQDVSRAELARRIGKTKGYVTQLLDGRTNMTIRTISDVCLALDHAVHFQDGSLDATVSDDPLLTMTISCPQQEYLMLTSRELPVHGSVFGHQRMVS